MTTKFNETKLTSYRKLFDVMHEELGEGAASKIIGPLLDAAIEIYVLRGKEK